VSTVDNTVSVRAVSTGSVLGSYTLGPLLGRGGMSDVYAASHRFLGDEVAIKVLRPELAGDAATGDAFVAEAARTRTVLHANVVRVIDFGVDPDSGAWFLVMDRIAGESLAARLRRVGRLDEPAVRELGAAIADGMTAVHAAGIVHRDLKPANVMLRGDVPTIVDFGIAKHLGNQSAVTTGRLIGTPAYMAPEQLTGGLVTPAIDVWALGVILFEAATGRLPFDGYTDGRCPQLFEAAPRASTLAPISPSLDRLIERCLASAPGQRPAMAAIAHELREPPGSRVTEDLGAAPAVVALPRVRRWWPTLVAVGAVVLAALALGAWRFRVAMRDADRATETATAAATATGTATGAATATATATGSATGSATATGPATATGSATATGFATGPATIALDLEIRTAPPGAEIFVDGVRAAATPAHIRLPGPRTIELRRPGYKPWSATIDRPGLIEVELDRAPREKPPRATPPRVKPPRVKPPDPHRETLD
jgi:hypothetical protein